MRVYGYDPAHWNVREWVLKTVGMEDLEPGGVILVSDHAEWPPWAVSWLWDAVTVHAQPVTLITDLGQFSPDVWRAWQAMRKIIGWRTYEIFAVPARQWPQYAHALGITAEGRPLPVGTWCKV